jgi:hypothetical protein
MKSEFETWPATPVEGTLKSNQSLANWHQPELLLLYKTEQPGSADHPGKDERD